MCSCSGCQRTSGSAFSYTAFFPDAQLVSLDGPRTEYVGVGDAGRNFTTGFCPTCGSPVYRRLDVFPGVTGVFVGCFAVKKFAAPGNWYHVVNRHDWLCPIDGITDNQTQ